MGAEMSITMGSITSKERTSKNTVVLHDPHGRGTRAPSLSPFVLKVETFLRMNRILYYYTDEGGFGENGQYPWIEFRKEKVSDSHFIIQHLRHKTGTDMDEHLTPEQKAISLAFRIMVEEYLNHSNDLEMLLWNETDRIREFCDDSKPEIWMQKAKLCMKLKAHRISKHSQEQIREITDEQLGALSTLLGDKPFMMGDLPTELDCSVFGVLGIMKYYMDRNMHPRSLIEDKYKNLDEYLDKIKAALFPDWDDIIEPFLEDDSHPVPVEDATEKKSVTIVKPKKT